MINRKRSKKENYSSFVVTFACLLKNSFENMSLLWTVEENLNMRFFRDVQETMCSDCCFYLDVHFWSVIHRIHIVLNLEYLGFLLKVISAFIPLWSAHSFKECHFIWILVNDVKRKCADNIIPLPAQAPSAWMDSKYKSAALNTFFLYWNLKNDLA